MEPPSHASEPCTAANGGESGGGVDAGHGRLAFHSSRFARVAESGSLHALGPHRFSDDVLSTAISAVPSS